MKKIIYIGILSVIISGFTISKRVEAMIQREIKSVFKVENYSKETISVSEEMNAQLPVEVTDENFFRIRSNGELLGYYYYGSAFGKADYFDFIVIFDKDLMVSKVKMLVYREDHGGEIGSKRWLKQFIGQSSDSKLEYQKDIVGISGATISAKSMTYKMNKVLKTIHILAAEQKL